MVHPYREPPPVEPARAAGGSLAAPTVVFGFVCSLVGAALGGPVCGLCATVVGVILILAPSRVAR